MMGNDSIMKSQYKPLKKEAKIVENENVSHHCAPKIAKELAIL
jgi:hypothetical protein